MGRIASQWRANEGLLGNNGAVVIVMGKALTFTDITKIRKVYKPYCKIAVSTAIRLADIMRHYI